MYIAQTQKLMQTLLVLYNHRVKAISEMIGVSRQTALRWCDGETFAQMKHLPKIQDAITFKLREIEDAGWVSMTAAIESALMPVTAPRQGLIRKRNYQRDRAAETIAAHLRIANGGGFDRVENIKRILPDHSDFVLKQAAKKLCLYYTRMGKVGKQRTYWSLRPMNEYVTTKAISTRFRIPYQKHS